MARLYPPTVNGTLPSFYGDATGTLLIKVPFIMNKTVSTSLVSSFKLRIRNGVTDTEIGILDSTNWDPKAGTKQVIFALPALNGTYGATSYEARAQQVRRKMSVGEYYKLQLAYVGIDSVVGYYSTVGIAKYTSAPILSIQNLTVGTANLDRQYYVGVYHNSDYTERAYQYKFDITNMLTNTIVETSGWCIHDSTTDDRVENPYESTDSYNMQYEMDSGAKYSITYSVITNNELEVSSPSYILVNTESIPMNVEAKVKVLQDYDNGFLRVQFWGLDPDLTQRDRWTAETEGEFAPVYQETPVIGQFSLSRTDSKSNFTLWTHIQDFQLYGKVPSTFVYKDFSVEHGVTYVYAIQQYNSYGLYSTRLRSESIDAQFEDLYLYDGQRQLKVRFNPKVTSFKAVVSETKKNTLGSKYPFFFRNGIVEYKEFPISGLISYLSDNDEYFMSRTEELGMDPDWEDSTDLTDENIFYERKFKLKVLEWLNNGEPKLFRSPAEGNYIVRLQNVSLSPNDSLGRMLHTFSCTADEIDDYTMDNLESYNFFAEAPIVNTTLQFGTIQLAQTLADLIRDKTNISDPVAERQQQGILLMKTYDLLQGAGVRYIKFEDVAPGSQFMLGDQTFVIGATGIYEATYEQPEYGLYYLSSDNLLDYIQVGGGSIVTIGIVANVKTSYDYISDLTVKDIALDPVGSIYVDEFLAAHTSVRESIARIYHARFFVCDEYAGFNGTEAELKARFNAYTANVNVFMTNPNQNDVMSANYWESRRTGQELTLPNAIYKTVEYDGTVKYWRYTEHPVNGEHFVSAPAIDTKIYYGNQEIDIAARGVYELKSDIEIPSTLRWGNGVTAEISYQIRRVHYGIEDSDEDLRNLYSAYMAAKKAYYMAVLGLRFVDAASAQLVIPTSDQVVTDNTYYVWEDEDFRQTTQTERENWFNNDAYVTDYNVNYTTEEIENYYYTYINAKNNYEYSLQAKLNDMQEE